MKNINGNNALKIIDSNSSIEYIVFNQNLYFE